MQTTPRFATRSAPAQIAIPSSSVVSRIVSIELLDSAIFTSLAFPASGIYEINAGDIIKDVNGIYGEYFGDRDIDCDTINF